MIRVNSASSVNLLGAGKDNNKSLRKNSNKLNSINRNNNNLERNFNKSLNSIDEYHLSLENIQRSPITTTTTTTTTSVTFEKAGIRNGYFLWIMTPVAASLSLAIVIAALAGPQWLLTEEKLPNANYNGTTYFRNQEDDGAFIKKTTKSSLWILCSALQGIETYNCIKIDYFPNEEYRNDPLDSTLAIPYTVTKSCPFFLVSGVCLLISFIVFLIPTTISNQNNLYYFSAGILFIVSGLIMLIGLIVYISIFKAEIGSKLRQKSTLHPPLFKFSYGQSFFLYVFGFISTEFVGLLNIFLYISLQQIGHKKKNFPCLTNNTSNYHDEKDNDGGFGCKKHSGKSRLFMENERRFYLEKSRKCDIHSKNLAKSLNELYTEPAPTFLSFEYPQEFPLTRSVSTTTEIFSETNSSRKKNQKNQTIGSKESLNDICGLSSSSLSRGIRKTKDEIFNEFCKRAGVRAKPKNIYYIDEIDYHSPDDEKNVYIIDSFANLNKNNHRRYSFKEPIIDKKRNSNLSIRGFHYDKIYPKSLFDLDMHNSDIWNKNMDEYLRKNKFHDSNVYHSRTLPKSFLKRNIDFIDHESGKNSQFNSRNSLNSNQLFRKSCDNVNFCNNNNNNNNNSSIQWPSVIPASPSSFSMHSLNRNLGHVQQAAPFGRTNHRNTRTYDYEESYGAFDLDEMERMRRQSHASLFGDSGCYDMINGTAV